ncbi:hypothetical protein BS329_15660 [Amycolatopsis coloradensis]|uniref:Uncharacterized protein n=1 Tax=Amycolatopsis coloradensis TaxID=76021 RepID=A0A1R0KU88_9PSEU|nr:hypothetical protein [Amycolatopsis coloradensis]OLZ51699.1 hypothetical protein BS329_15660 [Amycolatopsis coloradensis]
MARTNNISPRVMLAALAVGSGIAGLVVHGAEMAAAAEASTAYGVSATGPDPLGAQPSVNSAGEVKSGSAGSIRSKTGLVVASGLAVKAGAGTASATVGNVTVGGKSIGAVSTTCTNGRASAGRSGTVKLSDTLSVTYGTAAGGKATGATIKLTGAGGKGATIQVAVISCGTGTPPTNPPTTPPEPGKPATGKPAPGKPTTGAPAPGQPGKPTVGKSGTKSKGETKTAPKPEPKPGHHAVTG